MTPERIEKLSFWLLAISLALICIVPFNYMPGGIPMGAKTIPVNHVLFFATGLVFCVLTLYFIVQYRTFPIFLTLGLILFGSMVLSSIFGISNRNEGFLTSLGFLFRALAPATTAYFLVRFTPQEDRLQAFLAFLAALVAFGALYEVVTGHYFLFERKIIHPEYPSELWAPHLGIAVGAVGQPLPLAVLLNLFFPLTLFSWKRFHLWIYLFINALILVAIVMTFRRSGYALMLLSLCFTALYSRWRAKTLGYAALGLLLASMAALPFVRQKISERFSLQNTVNELQTRHRGKAYGVSAKMARDYPLFGVGTRQYLAHYKKYAQYDQPISTPDNQYLRFLSEGGFSGLGAFLIFIGFVMICAWKHLRNPDGAPYLIAIIVFALAMLVNDGLYWPAIQMTSLVVIGMGMGHADRRSTL